MLKTKQVIDVPVRFLFAAVLLSLISSLCQGQVEVSTGSAGFSLGTGWGFDLGYGKVKLFDDTHLSGWRITGSFWKEGFDADKPAGDEGYFDWLIPTNNTNYIGGLGLGFLYLYDKLGGGVMLDYTVKTTWQNYRSPVTGWDWHAAEKRTETMGITLNLTYRLGETFDGALFIGTTRGFMVGGAWRF